MSSPTKSMIHVDKILTNISVAYMNQANTFLADKIFPNVPVAKQSDKYFTFNKDAFGRGGAEKRTGATESAGGGFQMSTDNYYCDQWSFHKDIPSDDAANADFDLFQSSSEFVTQNLLIRRESEFVNTYFAASVWGKDITGVASSPSSNQVIQWSDYSNSNPITDIKTGIRYVQKATVGLKPNTLILGAEVEDALIDHPDIIDKMKYTAIPSPNATRAMLAQMFGVDRVLVGESVGVTSVEGQTVTTGFQWGKKALLCYVAPRPSMYMPSAGYTFSWNAYGNGLGARIKRFPMVHLNDAERIEGDLAFDYKVVSADCGYFFDAIVA